MNLRPVILAVPQDAGPRSPAQVEQQRACARLALRHCASLCGAPLDGWRQDTADVPLPNEGYFWSVSHKRHWVAAVVADAPVGIDIEHIAPRPRKLHDALADDAEWELMGDRSWLSFFRLWTAKEAVLKAAGTGIAGLAACRLVGVDRERRLTLDYEGRRSRIEHFYHTDHVTAVTCDQARAEWCVLDRIPRGAPHAPPS